MLQTLLNGNLKTSQQNSAQLNDELLWNYKLLESMLDKECEVHNFVGLSKAICYWVSFFLKMEAIKFQVFSKECVFLVGAPVLEINLGKG
jgi:hypothetical protein